MVGQSREDINLLVIAYVSLLNKLAIPMLGGYDYTG